MSEFTGKTIEEAVQAGLSSLNLTEEQADIVVLEEPTKGLIRAKKARVRVSKKVSDGQRAVEFIDEVLEKMNYAATGELAEEGEKIIIRLIATNSSALIGYRGEVLDALQTLAGAVANIGRDDYKRVVVDCENYREKREETLKALALRLADKAVLKARKVTLEPMNPYERRIIHAALAEKEGIKTVSEGKEPNRFIAIIPDNMRHYDNRSEREYSKNTGRGAGGNRSGGFNRDRREGGGRPGGFNRDRREGGFNRDRGERSSTPREKRPATTFGTYLGNSMKD